MNREEIDRAVQAFDKLKLLQHRSRQRLLPSFIGIGPARAGSTSLYQLLRSHPRLFLPAVKEINYFGFRSRVKGARPWGMGPDEYRTYFVGAPRNALCGEISPSYFILPEAICEIHALIPNCKIICGLRNPLERLVSHFKYHQAKHGYQAFDAFIQGARKEFDRINDPMLAWFWFKPTRILASSLFAPTLSLCMRLFGPESVHVYLFEDFVENEACTSAILEFLGVEPVGLKARKINASRPVDVSLNIQKQDWEWLCELFSSDLAAAEKIVGCDLGGYKDFDGAAHRSGLVHG